MAVQELKFSPDTVAPELSADEKQIVANKMAALSKIFDDKVIKAKYKLELTFGKSRSMQRPTPGILTFWANGSKFHGGGDEKIYLCPGKHLHVNECEKPIPELANSMGTLVCPSCGTLWKGEQVIGELMANLPLRKWSEVLYAHYRKFEYSCDIYLKYSSDDIRSVALAQKEKATFKGSILLEKTRARRAKSIYPLKNLIKDANNGSDLLGRMYSFITS